MCSSAKALKLAVVNASEVMSQVCFSILTGKKEVSFVEEAASSIQAT